MEPVEYIFAPLDGVVTRVTEDGVITVYVSPTDSHVVYAPSTGKVTDVREVYGKWIRPGVFNVPDQEKTGRVITELTTPAGRVFEFWIEVGHGKYITDTVELNMPLGSHVVETRVVGRIIIGSLYELHLPSSKNGAFVPYAYVGESVNGGISAIGKYVRQ